MKAAVAARPRYLSPGRLGRNAKSHAFIEPVEGVKGRGVVLKWVSNFQAMCQTTATLEKAAMVASRRSILDLSHTGRRGQSFGLHCQRRVVKFCPRRCLVIRLRRIRCLGTTHLDIGLTDCSTLRVLFSGSENNLPGSAF